MVDDDYLFDVCECCDGLWLVELVGLCEYVG